MTRLSKPDFKSAIKDIESVYLLEVRNNRVYLLGDMEYGGESQTPRLEWMNLEIDKSQAIRHAVNDSRNSGGSITITEYTENQTDEILNDFLSYDTTCYICCNDDEMQDICREFDNMKIYVNVVNMTSGEKLQ